MHSKSPRPARIALTLYLLFMLSITLLIFHEKSPPVQLRPFVSIARDWHKGGWAFWVNLVGNFVAFLPIGMLLPAARGVGRRTFLWHAISISGGFSVTIELAQYLSGVRTCDIDDVLLNTLGGACGLGLDLAFLSKNRRGGENARDPIRQSRPGLE